MTDRHIFSLTRLRFADRSWQPHWPALSKRIVPLLESRGAAVWGAFSGLFGIASNELMLMTHGAAGDPRPPVTPDDAAIVEQYLLVPTARPPSPPPVLERPGVYVFRFFDVDNRHVDEIVGLSRQAWTTFENTTAYASEPLGLFAPADAAADHGRMLLLTWYDGLRSWELSRTPAPEARANFLRRHELTGGTVAYATALVGSA